MSIKSFFRWFFYGAEPLPPSQPVLQVTMPPEVQAAVYLPLWQAAERASTQLYMTVFYQVAMSDGQDYLNPITNWFANLIASTVPVAIMEKDGWRDYPPDLQAFDVVSGGSRAQVRGFGATKFDVAVRSDVLEQFLDHMHLVVRSNPGFYELSLPPSVRHPPPQRSEPNRQNNWDWEKWDEAHRRTVSVKLLQEANDRLAQVDELIKKMKAPPSQKAPKKKKPKGRK